MARKALKMLIHNKMVMNKTRICNYKIQINFVTL